MEFTIAVFAKGNKPLAIFCKQGTFKYSFIHECHMQLTGVMYLKNTLKYFYWIQNNLWEQTKCGESVDIFPYAGRATLDAMLRCSLSYEGNVQEEA